MRRGICVKCSSRKIVAGIRVVDRDQGSKNDLTAEIYKNPDALFFKGATTVLLRALICGDCGYTELYAIDPESLYSDYVANQSENAVKELGDGAAKSGGNLAIVHEEGGALSLSNKETDESEEED